MALSRFRNWDRKLLLSVVVPVCNEVSNVVAVADQTAAALSRLGGRWELIFIDDGSRDQTGRKLLELAATRAEIRVLFHAFNAGQSAAVATGFAAAAGFWVATLDGDGQNDPADLLLLLRRARIEGADCVTGIRVNRLDPWRRRVASRFANWFCNMLTGHQIADRGCGIRMIRRQALAENPVFNGMHHFLPTLFQGRGLRVVEQEVRHHRRLGGVSKYSIGKLAWRGFRDCLGVRWYLARAVPADRLKSGLARPSAKEESLDNLSNLENGVSG